MSIFVDDDDMIKLTGYRSFSKQIEQLKIMGVPFRINGLGRPMVAVTVIEGGRRAEDIPRKVTSPAFTNR